MPPVACDPESLSGAPPSVPEVAVEPVEHSGHPVDPTIRPPGYGERMELVGVENVFDLAAKDAQRDEQLLVVGGGATTNGPPPGPQEGRPDARDVAERRLAPQLEHPVVRQGVAEQRCAVVIDAGVRIRPA